MGVHCQSTTDRRGRRSSDDRRPPPIRQGSPPHVLDRDPGFEIHDAGAWVPRRDSVHPFKAENDRLRQECGIAIAPSASTEDHGNLVVLRTFEYGCQASHIVRAEHVTGRSNRSPPPLHPFQTVQRKRKAPLHRSNTQPPEQPRRYRPHRQAHVPPTSRNVSGHGLAANPLQDQRSGPFGTHGTGQRP